MKSMPLLIFILLFFRGSVYAQTDAALISSLITELESDQVKKNGEFYAGMFPSNRKCAGFPHNFQPDNNIFYTAITAFTLKNMIPYLTEYDQLKAKQIIKNAASSYAYYRNPNGKPYYGFWPAGSRILPHSFFINRFNGIFAHGDDADDSVMILMASDNNDSNNTTLKDKLVQVSNLQKRKINSTCKKYRSIPAYSTYLGENMHPDFDFAVQCNILYFIYANKLPLVKQDSATILLLSEMIRNRDYMKRPVYISPYYVKPAILIYHITRLMGAFDPAALQPYKNQLIKDVNHLLLQENNIMEEIILRTAILRLGAEAPSLKINTLTAFEKSDQSRFIFFQARAAFAQPTPVKQVFLHFDYLNYFFYCTSYNKALWLEYLVLKNRLTQNKKN